MSKSALITGITGQDGSYLAEYLVEKGYKVHGIVRRSSSYNLSRLDALIEREGGRNLFFHYADLLDAGALTKVLFETEPDEVYNLAAQSHVKVSFDAPKYTADATSTGVLQLLESVRQYETFKNSKIRVYQAGSSEMFGASPPPQSERTPFYPRSPYAVSKVAAYWHCINYREAYGMFITNGILFNHESPRRGEEFVTRKITRAVGRIKYGVQQRLYLGNMDAKRDWGFAGDYVKGMWMMLQQSEPGDFVLSTGESHSVREFVEMAFGFAELDWKSHVVVDEGLYRPTEVDFLLGDSTLSREKLGWQPTMSFEGLVRLMLEEDLELARKEAAMGLKVRSGEEGRLI